MRGGIFRKGTIVVLVMLVASIVVIPTITVVSEELKKDIVVPRDYQTIQEAIDIANPGDSILVWSGIYQENIHIYQGKNNIQIIGNFSDRPIIDGGRSCDVVKIVADNIILRNFNIRMSGELSYGISIRAQGIQIENCNITDNFQGIFINSHLSVNIKIKDCEIIDNSYWGIQIEDNCDDITINNSVISQNKNGITAKESTSIDIINNQIYENDWIGVAIEGKSSHDNLIDSNDIIKNDIGIYFWCSGRNNIVSGNNIIDNGLAVVFKWSNRQKFSGNYWEPRRFPSLVNILHELLNKPIPYYIIGHGGYPEASYLPLFIQVDNEPKMERI